MSAAVKFSGKAVQAAKKDAKSFNRSVLKKIAEENPDLSRAFIKDILLGLEGKSAPFVFKHLKGLR